MEEHLKIMLVAILNQCFAMTNTIPKYLHDPANPQMLQACEELSSMLNEYIAEAKRNS